MNSETMTQPAASDTHSAQTSDATCHSGIQMLLGLVDGSTDNRNLDLSRLNHFIEMLTSPLGDNDRKGRLFEEIFPLDLVDTFSYRDPSESTESHPVQTLPGYWTDADGRRVLEAFPLERRDRYTARAKAAYIRLWMIPTAWLNLCGFLRHMRNTNAYPDPSTSLKIDRALAVLDGNDYWRHTLTGFYVKQHG